MPDFTARSQSTEGGCSGDDLLTRRSQPAEPDAPRVPPLVEHITEVLRKHQWRKYDDRCRCDDPGTYDEHPEHVSNLIAQAAEEHYRPRVETVEQLDALPGGSVVRDASRYVHEKRITGGRRWWQAGWEGERWSDEIDLPAVVLWSPGAGE